jgi:Xaa-Pro dipeptidase
MSIQIPPTQSRSDEVREKLTRVRDFLSSKGVDGVLFTTQSNLAWATAGTENSIIRGHDPGFVNALVTHTDAYVLTQNIEGPRLKAEAGLDEVGFEVRTYDWWTEGLDDLVAELCRPARLANDGSGPGAPMAMALQQLRLILTTGEQARLRKLGLDCCEVMEEVTSSWSVGTTERQIAASVVAGCEERGIFPPVLLVGGDERRRTFRHPTISDARVERDVLTVIVGVRGGLHVALSRTASQGTVEPDLAERHAIASTVEAHEIAASRTGSTWGAALQAGVDAYDRLGYAGEWRHHYQGGPIGYAPREFGPTPPEQPNAFTAAPVAIGQAYAWNPTVQGAKSEDTFIVSRDGFEAVSNSASWPTINCESPAGTIPRPAILEI